MTRTNRAVSNRIAMISGGGGDIGGAVALQLAQEGASVALADLRPPQDLQGTVAKLREMDVKVRYDVVDVSDADAVEQWTRSVVDDLGVPTIVIPNAGVVVGSGLLETSPAQWRRTMSVNLDGAWHVARSGARAMVAGEQPGHIVFIGSIAAHLPSRAMSAYAISKAAVRAMCRCLALELAEHRILVNEVAPGNVDAGLSARIFADDPTALRAALDKTPLHCLVDCGDVARQVVWLCSHSNRAITGTTLVIDAGYSLRGDD